MLCVIPYFKGDRDLAQKLVAWIKELGDPPTLYLVRDAHADPIDTLGLDVRKEIVVTESWNSWPKSPNWMVSQVGRDILSEPWLWCEPDCVPMAKGWWQALKGEWEKARAAGKWFVGDRVEVENVPVHMSGIGIYPPNVIEHAGLMLIAHDIAFDVEAAPMILPKMYQTKLISHSWKHPPINNLGELNNLRGQHPDCVLFHADKAHSIIPMLRAELNLGGEGKQHAVLADTHPRPSNEPVLRTDQEANIALWEGMREKMQRPSNLTCDIFIKTYPPDYPWLEYCLRSINKFADHFRRVRIISSEQGGVNTSALLSSFGADYAQWQVVGEQPDGYLWQMVIKLDADRYTDASHILYIDSDTIFTRPVSPFEYLTYERKVIWMMTPYEKVTTPWQQVIEKFLKKPVRFEFMRRQPFLVPRWLLAELRAFCEREHGVTLDAYVLSQPHRAFSEFNALGAFAYEYFRDEFVWVNTEETPPDQWPELTVMQSWSRGGLTDEIKKTYDKILSGEDSPAPIGERKNGGGEIPDIAVSEMPLQRDAPPSTVPLRLSNNAAKWDRVEQLVLELKGYCTSPIDTSRVRKALVGAGIFPQVILGWLKQKKAKKRRVVSSL